METNKVRKATPEDIEMMRAYNETLKRERERIANLAGTPRERFTYRLRATLSVSKTVVIEAESKAHADAVLEDQLDRDEHFEVRDDEGPCDCGDYRYDLQRSEPLPVIQKIDQSQSEMPL